MLPESDNDFTYLERIDVFPEHQNKGYGTKALTELGNIFGDYYAAADNEGAQRLYDRLGSRMRSSDYDSFGFAIDQGYGVHELSGGKVEPFVQVIQQEEVLAPDTDIITIGTCQLLNLFVQNRVR